MEKSSILTHILPSQFLYTNKGIVKASSLEKGFLLKNNNQELVKVLDNKRMSSQGIIVKLKNGEEFFLEESQQIKTLRGWILAKDLKEDDLLLIRLAPPISLPERPKIPFENQINSSATPINAPEYLSSELALWLGIIAARGRINHNNGIIGIEEKDTSDKELIELFCLLTKFIFKVTPHEFITKNKRKLFQIYSKNMSRFIKQMIGLKTYLKKVPSPLLKSGLDEQLSFIRGLSFKGYPEKNHIVIFSGSSIALADFIFLVLKHNGYLVSRKSSKSSTGKTIHYVKLLGALPLAPPYWDPTAVLINTSIVKIPNEIYKMRVSMKNPSYESYRSIKKYKKIYCSGYILNNLKISYPENQYYLKISNIKLETRSINIIETNKPLSYSGLCIK